MGEGASDLRQGGDKDGGAVRSLGHCPQASSSDNADFLQMKSTSPPLPRGKSKKPERGVGCVETNSWEALGFREGQSTRDKPRKGLTAPIWHEARLLEDADEPSFARKTGGGRREGVGKPSISLPSRKVA